MGIGAVILAAGASKRFGGDKLKLGLNGISILEHLIRAVSVSGFEEAVLVSNDEELLKLGRKYGFSGVNSPEAHLGQGASVKAGLSAINQANDMMFFVGDQPLIDAQIISALKTCHAGQAGSIIIPMFNGQSGSPVIFPRRCREQLFRLSGDYGGKSIVDKAVVKCWFGDALRGMDIDTKEDYNKLLVVGSNTVAVRGGGDLATGVVQKLHRSGFFTVVLETGEPSSIRRTVCLSEAVYEGTAYVEDITARLIHSAEGLAECFRQGIVPVLIDPEGVNIPKIGAVAVVDAIMAKHNTGTHRGMAPVTIALGPGFEAGSDVDIVIETKRGHNLGQIIRAGAASPNTGIPGDIGGVSAKRVIHSPAAGVLSALKDIGQRVTEGETLAVVADVPVPAPISGLLRGMIKNGYFVSKGMKIADIDPRESEYGNHTTVSDKARALGGAVLEALLWERRRHFI